MPKKKPVQPTFHPPDMEYELDEFVVPSQDERGHSSREYIRCPPGWERDMEVIIESRKFPYQTKSDLIRHAMFRHLAWLHRIADEIPKSYFSSLMIQRRVMQEHKFQADTEHTFKALADMIDLYVSRSDFKAARKMVSSCLDSLRSVAECGWKTRFHSRFMAQYGYLIDSSVTLPTDATEMHAIQPLEVRPAPVFSDSQPVTVSDSPREATGFFVDTDADGMVKHTPLKAERVDDPQSRADNNTYLMMNDPEPVQVQFFDSGQSKGVGVLVFVNPHDEE